ARALLEQLLRGDADQLMILLPTGDALDDINYLQFAFHKDVHLYALLSAARLLRRNSAHSLWDMIRMSLSYARGPQRAKLFRRLSDADEGHQAQFASLASPPTITLALEPDSPYANTPVAGRGERVDEGDARYRLRLASDASATLPQRVRRVNPQAINDALDGLDTLLRSTAATEAEWNYLASLGDSLGEDLLGDLRAPLDQLQRELEASRPNQLVHLALRVPRELMRYPWELMRDGTQMLAQRFAVGRQVWSDSTRIIERIERDADPLRVLIVGDPTLHAPYASDAQLAGARDEAEEVAALFEDLTREFGRALDFRRDRDVFIRTTLTRAAMRRLLRDNGYDIVHFAGHGRFSAGRPERSAWLLSDGPLWASELRNTFAWSRSPPWLIYANACEAGMTSDREGPRYTGDVFGLATACINQGVEAYVAPLWPLDDRAGKHMATSFYRELMLQRATLGAALHQARLETEKASRARARTGFGIFDISWASMVLYGDPGARLIDALGGEL
ncbi:MAG: CHAT domain-containing protein, partial [Myxococcales bacterium]|nr:CHAT domain-containing protein [Myxococcales bacterium]